MHHPDYTFLGNVDNMEIEGNRIDLHCSPAARLRIVFLDHHIFRVTLSRGDSLPPTLDHALVERQWPKIDLQVQQSGQSLEVTTAELHLRINLAPCRITVSDLQGRIINQDDPAFGMGWDGDEICVWKTASKDEKYYGLGEKTGALNKIGRTWVMWNNDVPCFPPLADPLYQSIPFYLGIRDRQAYGIFLNNSSRSRFDFCTPGLGAASFRVEKGPLDYFFITGPHPERVVSAYTELTGRPPMWPRWALGYQQSRWSYYPADRIEALAREFRAREMPCDAIHLDIHYMDDYRVFTWHPHRFPEPEKMIAALQKRGIRLVVIVEPAVKADPDFSICREGLQGGHFIKYPDNRVYTGRVWPGDAYFVDFSRPRTRSWWAEKIRTLIRAGVAGLWNDMNEPAAFDQSLPDTTIFDDEGKISGHKKMHNLYGSLMARSAYEGALLEKPNLRPFVITRAGFAGEQRFTTVWTGDNCSTEEHLELGIRMLQGLGISGMAFCGMDVGGFCQHPSPELFARWMQVGAISPFFRTHSIINSPAREPWSFGDEIEEINRKTLQLRYQLLPYLYSVMWQAHRSGAPFIRPLFWHDPNDDSSYAEAVQHQFMLGSELLAAPVTRVGRRSQRVWFPAGNWLDLADYSVHAGPQNKLIDAPLDKLPLFLKAGGLLPLWPEPVAYTDEKPMRHVEWLINCTADGEFDLYEDDGATLDYTRGVYRLSRWSLSALQEMHLRRSLIHDGWSSTVRTWTLRFCGLARPPQKVRIDGKACALESIKNAHWNQPASVLTLQLLKKDFAEIDLIF